MKNLKRYIITPTFSGHFPFIKKYLESYDYYVEDKDSVSICFTINKYEKEAFDKIIHPYIKRAKIEVLIFDDILDYFGILLTPDNLLKKYGKFSFQTLKKFYTMLYLKADQFLVLDSESMWVNKTNMNQMFDDFFQSPYISGSQLDVYRISDFKRKILQNIEYIYSQKIPFWFLENFVWFYDKKILIDLFNEFGSPYELVDKVYLNNRKKDGIFEILLYQTYIYLNLKKYNYKFYNLNKICEKVIDKKIWENYYFELTDRWNGDFGLLEQTMALLNKYNLENFINLFSLLKFPIIRCGPNNDLKLQKIFYDKVSPKILAASQDHKLGINSLEISKSGRNITYLSLKNYIKGILKKILPSYKVSIDIRNELMFNRMLINKVIMENKKLREEISNLNKN